jgi:hypothetical protein
VTAAAATTAPGAAAAAAATASLAPLTLGSASAKAVNRPLRIYRIRTLVSITRHDPGKIVRHDPVAGV